MNLKMILTGIAIALVAFIGFGLFKASQLTNIHITKEVTVNSDKQTVYDMVKYLNNFPKWSPFKAADPDQKHEVKGTDGTIGAQFHWDGNGGKDIGYQEIVKIEPNFIGMKCDIQKPFVAHPTFDYTFVENGNNVTVKQDFKLESGLVDSFFMWLFGAKADMAKMNQQGLDLLKKAVEG